LRWSLNRLIPSSFMPLTILPCGVLDHLAGFIPVASNYARLRQTCSWCYKSISAIVPATLVTLETIELDLKDIGDDPHCRWRDSRYTRFEAKLSHETIQFIIGHSTKYKAMFRRFLERFSKKDFAKKLYSGEVYKLWFTAVENDWVDTVRKVTHLVPSEERDMRRIAPLIGSLDMLQFFIESDLNVDAPGLLKSILRMANQSEALRMFEYLSNRGCCFKPSKDVEDIILSAHCDATHGERIEIIRRLLDVIFPATAPIDISRWIDEAALYGNIGGIIYLRQQAIEIDLNHCLRRHAQHGRHMKPGIIRYLVTIGADVNHKHAGKSFLSFFLKIRGLPDTFQLFELGALMESDKFVDEFVHALVMREYETCEKLLGLGFDINARNKDGDAAIHLIIRREQYSKKHLIWLIRHGADINLRGGDHDRTPLLLLVASRREWINRTMVKRLYLEGADPRLRDSDGKDASDYGEDHGITFPSDCVRSFCVRPRRDKRLIPSCSMPLTILPCDVLDYLAGYIPVAANYARLRQTCSWCYESISAEVPVTLVTLETIEFDLKDIGDDPHCRWRDSRFTRFEAKLSHETVSYIISHSTKYRAMFGRFLERFSTNDFAQKLFSYGVHRLLFTAVENDWVDTVRKITHLVPSEKRDMRRIAPLISSWDMMQFFIGSDFEVDAPGLLEGTLRMADQAEAMRMFEYCSNRDCFKPSKDLENVILSAHCDATHEYRIEIIRNLLDMIYPATAPIDIARWIDEAALYGNMGVIIYLRQQAIEIDLNYCLRKHARNERGIEPGFIRSLVTIGADINNKHAGKSFLSYLVKIRRLYDPIQLLELGALMESHQLVDSFVHALVRGGYETCEKLLRLGFDINARNKDGNAAIHLIVQEKENLNKRLIWLIRHGSDINLRGGYHEQTPLLLLVDHRRVLRNMRMIRRLYLEGADPRLRDSDGKDAFDYAKYRSITFPRH
jgi:ankyrin repeat protein